jgi:hypothetical protein
MFYISPTSATGTAQPGMNCRPALRASVNMDAWYMRPLPLHNASWLIDAECWHG